MFRNIVWPQELSALVHANIIQIILTVGTLEQPPVFGLAVPLRQQQIFDCWDQREGAKAGLGLEDILPYRHEFAIHVHLNHLVGDGDGLFLEVYGIPAQAQGFTAPQAVVSGDLDAQLQRIARDGIK